MLAHSHNGGLQHAQSNAVSNFSQYNHSVTAAADPFEHLAYRSVGVARRTEPERAPAPPLASYSAGQVGQPVTDQLSVQNAQRVPESQQQGPQSTSLGSSMWAQPDGQKEAAASFEFGESAFHPVQTTPPQQSERPMEAARPRNLYINSLYNSEDGAVDEQPPPGFDPAQQVRPLQPDGVVEPHCVPTSVLLAP